MSREVERRLSPVVARSPEVLQRTWLTEAGGSGPGGDPTSPTGRPSWAAVGDASARRRASAAPGRTPLSGGVRVGDPLPWSEIGPEPDAVLLGPDLVGQVAEILTAPEARRRGACTTPRRPWPIV